jgi:hypothetical protein
MLRDELVIIFPQIRRFIWVMNDDHHGVGVIKIERRGSSAVMTVSL